MHVRRIGTSTALGLAIVPLLCLAACDGGNGDDSEIQFDLELEVSEVIPTVAFARFTVDSPEVTEAWLEYGLDADNEVLAPAADDGQGGFEAVLLGMKGSHEYRVRPVVVIDGEQVAGDEERITTGGLPTDLPKLTVTVQDETRATPGFYVMSLHSEPSGSVIVDHDGDIVWWHREDVGDDVFPVGRSRISRDRLRMLYQASLWSEDDEDYVTYILQVTLDGTSQERVRVAAAHHDFTELPDGTLAAIMIDSRIVEDEEIHGDRITEVRPDGTEVDVWSVWDVFEYSGDAPGATDQIWTHSNAIDYDEESDSYSISVRNQDAIVVVDRSSGETLSVIGGELSDYTLAGDDPAWFDRQHQFFGRDDELYVFSNGFDYEAGSRVLGYQLDDASATAVNHWRYEPQPPLYCYTLGDVGLLPSGNLLVTWTTAGQLEEITPEGEMVWQVKADLGAGFGYTTFTESLYPDA